MLDALLALLAGGFSEGSLAGEAGVLGLVSAEELFDGEDLEPGVLVAGQTFRLVEAGGDSFLGHGVGWFFEGDEDAEGGVLAFHIALERGDLAAVDVSALDLDDDALGLVGVVIEEVDVAVDAGVGALLASGGGAGVDETERPVLELVAAVVVAVLGQGAGAGDIFRQADDVVLGEFGAEGVVEAVFHQGDGDVGDVDADPASLEALGDGNSGAAAAEGVEDDIALVAAGVDDAFEQGFWLLCGIAEALFGP